ncbi:MAG: PAS domain-containing protein, partial [Inhella sp.]
MSAEQPSPNWRGWVTRAAGSHQYAVLLTLAAVLATVLGIAQAFRAAWLKGGEQLTAANRLQVRQVEAWLQERQVDVRNMLQVHELLVQWDPACQPASDRCDELARRILAAFLNNGGFRSITLSSKHAPPSLRVGVELRPSDLKLMQGAQSAVDRVPRVHGFEADGLGGAALLVAQQSQGEGRASLFASLDPSEMLRHLLGPPIAEHLSLDSAVVRMDGPDASGLLVAKYDIRHVNFKRPAPGTVIAQLASGQQAPGQVFVAQDFRGVTVLAIGQRVENTDWWLISKLDRAEILAPALFPALQLGLAGLLAIGTCWGVLVIQRQRTRLRTACELAQERQERQERLQALELLYSIANTSEDLLFAKDLNHRYLLFNPAAQRLSGLSAEQVDGQSDEDLLPADQARTFLAQDKEVLTEGRTLRFEMETDGPDPRTISVVKAPLRGDDGQIVGLFGIGHDITAVKQGEARLRASDARFRTLFDESGVAMVIVDLESGQITGANQQALRETGCHSPSEMAQLPFAPAPYSREDAFANIAALQARWAKGEPALHRQEWLNARRDGSHYWIDLQ